MNQRPHELMDIDDPLGLSLDDLDVVANTFDEVSSRLPPVTDIKEQQQRSTRWQDDPSEQR